MKKIIKYINKTYINNYSDIKSFSKDKEFIEIINKLDENNFISVTSHLIHKENVINQIEQFIFNLDNYITYIKQLIKINPLELKYIINLTLYNKYNKILYSDIYYYENTNKYHQEFNKMFLYNYKKNIKKFNNKIIIKDRNFKELINHINNKQKRIYFYFENITNKNIFFYKTIIELLEKTSL